MLAAYPQVQRLSSLQQVLRPREEQHLVCRTKLFYLKTWHAEEPSILYQTVQATNCLMRLQTIVWRETTKLEFAVLQVCLSSIFLQNISKFLKYSAYPNDALLWWTSFPDQLYIWLHRWQLFLWRQSWGVLQWNLPSSVWWWMDRQRCCCDLLPNRI